MRKFFYFILIMILCLVGGYFFALLLEGQFSKGVEIIGEKNPTITPEAKQSPSQNSEPKNSENGNSPTKNELAKPVEIGKKIEQIVPFITQAPFANWKNPNFQNGCEEASVVMAMAWIKGEKAISPSEAQKRILEIVDFENKNFGYSTDTNAADMEKIFRQFFQHQNVGSRENITLNDIKAELQKGNLVIVPAYGRALQNPNFTQPGPVAHMLVIIGYDPVSKQFITNDPGTRNGAGYRYGENLFFDAIWEYPSGATDPPLPVKGKIIKALISVGK